MHSNIRRSLQLGTALACAAVVLPASQASAASPVVQTAQGPVQGFTSKGIDEFFGIPYAAPPVGALRWMPPAAPAKWSGTLDATRFAPICAQITTLGVFAGPANNNEDCLYLNVFTPKLGAAQKLPVLVWIHGGGNVDGEANDYDGSGLAKDNAVVVTFNYRLGLLGWLAHPALDAEGHAFGNYGLLDQQAVLKWVQQNIAAFGGDPTRVALGGQSAGSVDTEANVASPLAAGLFNRGIFESVVSNGTPLPQSEAIGTEFAVAAGCGLGKTAAAAACLRKLPVKTIMALQGTQSTSGPYVVAPIDDGEIVPAAGLYATFASGKFNHMPIMSGTVHDEWNFILAIDEYFSGPPRTPITMAQYENYVVSSYPTATAQKIMATFPMSDYPTAQLLWDAVGTDTLVCPQYQLNRTLSAQVPVYGYEFNDVTAPFYFPPLPGFVPLAYHTADIQYLFPLWHGGPKGIAHPLNAQQTQLSVALTQAWVNFADTGNPDGAGNRPWPVFKPRSAGGGYYLSENIPALTTISDTQFAAEHKCAFWEPITGG